MKRLVRFSKQVAAYLEEPQCDLEYKGCTRRADTFYDVHGCANYYACSNCGNMLAAQMLKSFTTHKVLRCKKCESDVSAYGFVTITELNMKEENEKKKKSTGW